MKRVKKKRLSRRTHKRQNKNRYINKNKKIDVKLSYTDVEEVDELSKVDDVSADTDSLEAKESQFSSETKNEKEVVEGREKSRKLNQTLRKSVTTFALISGIGYAVGVYYFSDKFLPNTRLNDMDISLKGKKELEDELKIRLGRYKLDIMGREQERYSISGRDIGLEYEYTKSIEELIAEQNEYSWFLNLFDESHYNIPAKLVWDEKLLNQAFLTYNFLKEENFKDAQDAYLAGYDAEKAYYIVEEYNGTHLDIEKAKESIRKAISSMALNVDLEKEGVYQYADIKKDDERLIARRDLLNKHAGTHINYAGGAVLDGSRISQWLSIDEQGALVLDEAGIRIFVDELAARYDTLGKVRKFITTDTREVEVPSKKYGWQIDKEGEFQAIRASVLAGEQLDREPVFSSRAASLEGNEIGNTYVEIDLSNQKLYYYRDGNLLLNTDIVTGNVARGDSTPAGMFSLRSKMRSVVLRGPDYAAPVKYWMPFNGGIGLHDANWRSSFGGSIYRSSGSHGCVNMPTEAARLLYENIEAGCPVVCYN